MPVIDWAPDHTGVNFSCPNRGKEESVFMCFYHQDIACWNPSMRLTEIVVPMRYSWFATFERRLRTDD